jgi:hypothetical protein
VVRSAKWLNGESLSNYSLGILLRAGLANHCITNTTKATYILRLSIKADVLQKKEAVLQIIEYVV